jgi:hypothetical protein
MQMLGAGGLPLLCDAARPPDEDNPRGYFEYEPVKRTARDPSWVAEAAGKAVKVVHALLRFLPPEREYRVLLTRRPLAQVLRSQERMLARRGQRPVPIAPERLAAVLERQLEEAEAWMGQRAGLRVLRVDYGALVRDPAAAARAIDRFLGGGLDRVAMASAVDPALHRERA